MEIGSKIYYEKLTGNIIIRIPEGKGGVRETTKEEDFEIQENLKKYNIEEVDYIELPYGSHATTFNNAKSYKINIKTRQLEVIHYTDLELEEIQEYQKTLEELSNRVSGISIYLAESSEVVKSVEDLIIQTELNKITEGMI